MNLTDEFSNIIELVQYFKDEATCKEFLERHRWPEGVVSPFDPTSTVYKCANGLYRCKNTEKYFNVRTGTIFEGTKVSLLKWFMAIYLCANHKKGISSHQLARDLSVTQKTAWFMLHRIRMAFDHPRFKKVFNDVVQADETFVGGKNKNRHGSKKVKNSQGRSFKDKTPVLGLMQDGQVVLKVAPNTQVESIRRFVKDTVRPGALLITDDWPAYQSLANEYGHVIVDHQRGEYVRGAFHTNGIEGFWSHLKRSIIGVYHRVTRKHLYRYCAEFAYRFNTRKMTDPQRFRGFMSAITQRLSYNKLTTL